MSKALWLCASVWALIRCYAQDHILGIKCKGARGRVFESLDLEVASSLTSSSAFFPKRTMWITAGGGGLRFQKKVRF